MKPLHSDKLVTLVSATLVFSLVYAADGGALALLAGTVFGTMPGALLVGFASTLGATLSFLAVRHWFRDGVQHRLGMRLAGMDAAMARHGRLGLFWLRLLPVVPFPC